MLERDYNMTQLVSGKIPSDHILQIFEKLYFNGSLCLVKEDFGAIDLQQV